MGLFSRQFKNVVEWNEVRDDVLFYKWKNNEIKKDSKLIIRPGQDAIFLYNGRVEGIFTESGDYEISSDIIPFLSTLKGFSFGFNSGLRAEVLFVNTKEFTVKWGTKSAINLPHPNMPGGLPIRAFGSFSFKISDYMNLIENIAGVKNQYTVDDIKVRVISVLDQLLMKWIVREGRDMFNLQSNSFEIARGIKEDLDMDLCRIGLTITDFRIENFNYPEQVQKMIDKNASYSMVGNVGHYGQVAAVEAMENGRNSTMNNMVNAGIGMQLGQQMINQMSQSMNDNSGYNYQQNNNTQQLANNMQTQVSNSIPKFCPNCGTKTNGMKFCGECGNKLG